MTGAAGSPVALLQRARGGDQAAVRLLIERNIDWLRERVRRRLSAAMRRELDSADLLQDVVVSLLAGRTLPACHDEEHFRAVLVRIIDADVRDRLRWQGRQRRARHREQVLPSDSSSGVGTPVESVIRPSQHADRDDRTAWIRTAMLRLDRDDQRVLQLRIWEQRPFGEIAELLGVAEDAARMRVNRALARLARGVASLRAIAPRVDADLQHHRRSPGP